MVKNNIDRQYQNECDEDSEHAGKQSDNERFCVKYACDIALRRSYGTQNPYLLYPFQNRNVCDNADHRYCVKSER